VYGKKIKVLKFNRKDEGSRLGIGIMIGNYTKRGTR
jgi:hypothetical protein